MLISRQAAIDALDVLCQEHRYKIPGKRETYSQYNEAWQDALDRAEGAIMNLPSAQPSYSCSHEKDAQPRMKGRWETDSYGAMDEGEYLMTRCTSCGSAFEYGHNLPYCGYCGSYNGEPPEGSIGEE